MHGDAFENLDVLMLQSHPEALILTVSGILMGFVASDRRDGDTLCLLKAAWGTARCTGICEDMVICMRAAKRRRK